MISSTALRQLNIRVLLKVMSLVHSKVGEVCLQEFLRRAVQFLNVNSFPVLVLFCSDILKKKDLDCKWHETWEQRQCIKRTSVMAYCPASRGEVARSIRIMWRSKTIVLKWDKQGVLITMNCSCLCKFVTQECRSWAHRILFISKFKFLKDLYLAATSGHGTVINFFGFGPLQYPHLGVSKRLKKCTCKLLCSKRVSTNSGWVLEQRQAPSTMRVSIPPGVKTFLSASDWDAGVLAPQEVFCSKSCYMQMNVLLLNCGVRGLRNEKDYCAVNELFPTTEVNIDRQTRFWKENKYD